MQFWDGTDTMGNGSVDGGVGTWTAAATNWTGQPGQAGINSVWGGTVGVFAGKAGGLVTVNGTQSFDTLQVSTDGYTLAGGTLAIAPAAGQAGTLNIDNGITTTIGSVIANGSGGALAKVGGGTLILSGVNTYAGGTILSGGVLQVAADANLGAASGGLSFSGGTLAAMASFNSSRAATLTADGRLAVADGTTLGLSGVISGPGGLVKSGLGTLVLTGVNSYGGGTTVAAGALIGNATAIPGGIANAGTLVFDQAGNASFAGDIAGFGGVDGLMVKRGAGTLTLAGNNSLDWTVETGRLVSSAERFGGNLSIGLTGAFSFTQTGDGVYGGVLSGTGAFSKDGAGKLVLTGDSSGFTGISTVTAGALRVNGTLGGTVTVLDGGALGGSGIVGPTMVASGGTIAPGNSIGTLHVNGDITFAPGSIYTVEVDPTGTSSDLIAATGKALLQGGSVVQIGANGTYNPTTTYTILTAAGGITGTFDAVSSDFAFLAPTLGYGANAVTLTLKRNTVAFPNLAWTRNQRATAGGLQTLTAGNAVYDAVVQLDAPTARFAFDQLSGEIHASAQTALIEDSRYIRDAATDRVRAAFDGVGTRSTPVLAYGPDGPVVAPPDTGDVAAWGQVFGALGQTNSDGNAAQLERGTAGFVMGADALADTWRLGLLAGYSHSSFNAAARASSGESDNIHLGLYGGTQLGALGLRAGAAYTWHDIQTSRSVAFTGFADGLGAGYGAGTAQVFGEAGYTIDAGGATFEPFAGLAYVNLATAGFTESGGAGALTGTGGSTDATFTTLGVRIASEFMIGDMKATARGMLGWRHAFGDLTPTSTHAFQGSSAFTVAGVPIAQDSAVIEAGLDLNLTDNATLGLSYSGQFGSGAQDQSAKLNFSFKF
ncbi:MAG TPA: autotransporter domain-containing protein [Acetobacteraceae bacterium]|nr:autotransporter domain-containing protein [Acetobacteraceae bacterium]